MPRTVVRLLAQPLSMAAVYTAVTVLVVGAGLVSTVGRALVLYPPVFLLSYVVVTRVLPLPSPDRTISLTWHFDDGEGLFRNVDDFLWRNDAKVAPAVVVPVATMLPFLLVPASTYASVGVPVAVLVLFGVGTAESWALYRLSAQYLPNYSPHLFKDDYEPPISEDT